MAARAIWKGHLQLGQLVCPVALHAAVSASERVSLHILNRKTGDRVNRVYLDSETGKPVEPEDQVKGYETDGGRVVTLEDEEIARAVPEGDKTLHVEAFVPCTEVDRLYLDRPYYLTPAEEAAETAFAVIREGLRRKKVAALARAVLFRRERGVVIRAQGRGLVASTLEFAHEVRDARRSFARLPEPKIDREMLDLARHIIDTKRGSFDPSRFEDRYDAALAKLVQAKAKGEAIPARTKPVAAEPIDLREALRQSAEAAKKRRGRAKSAPRRKAS